VLLAHLLTTAADPSREKSVSHKHAKDPDPNYAGEGDKLRQQIYFAPHRVPDIALLIGTGYNAYEGSAMYCETERKHARCGKPPVPCQGF